LSDEHEELFILMNQFIAIILSLIVLLLLSSPCFEDLKKSKSCSAGISIFRGFAHAIIYCRFFCKITMGMLPSAGQVSVGEGGLKGSVA
jgi:hypothetical protein